MLCACGDNAAQSGDDQPTPVVTVTDGDGAAIDMLVIGQTNIGQSASGTIRVNNIGAAPTGAIAIAISGDAANDFVIDNVQTTCAGRALAPGEGCNIGLAFRPTAVGDRVATLTITSMPGGTASVMLTGSAVMPDLHFNPTSLAFGQLEIGRSQQTTIELRNDGSGAAPIDAIAISGPYTIGFNTCGSSLAPGTSCDITVNATPQSLGSVNGNLVVTSAGTGYTAGLNVHGARKITVVTSGTGSGTITSSPAGINCGATCEALFEGPVVLTAAPGASTQITSWSVAGCAQNPTCTVSADITPITVTVDFSLVGASTVNIVFAGTGTGEVQVRKTGTGTIATCFASCPVPANPGDQLSIRVSTFSDFNGFANCTPGSTADCSLTVPVGTTNVTVTFDKQTNEQWTRLIPGTIPHAAVFDGSGNLIVASTTKLTKLGPTGSTLWTLDMNVSGLDTGPGDTIYVVNGTTLRKLAADGMEVWNRAATTACTRGHGVAVAANGDVSVRASDGSSVMHWTSNGTAGFTQAITSSAGRCSAAIDASGNTLVDVDNANAEDTDARVFAPDGTELTRILKIVQQYHAMLSSDGTGNVAACSSGHGDSYLTGPQVSTSLVIPSASYAPTWCSMAGNEVAWLFWPDDVGPGSPTKWSLHRYASGTVQTFAWSRDVLRAGSDKYGTTPLSVAANAAKRMALVGHYTGITTDSAWVQIFDP